MLLTHEQTYNNYQSHKLFDGCYDVSLSILRKCSWWTWVSLYQNASVLDFIGAKVDAGGGNNWSC